MPTAQLFTIGLFALLLTQACSPDPSDRYREWERKELATGERSDSLFGGLYLGMSHDSFRIYCLQQHRAGRFAAGGLHSAVWVSYRVDSLLSRPVEFNFYPGFENGSIASLDADLYYVATAVRDTAFNQDTLLSETLRLMNQWYGDEFIRLPAPTRGQPDLYVKVTDNRRLVLHKHVDGYRITLRFTDLSSQLAEHR